MTTAGTPSDDAAGNLAGDTGRDARAVAARLAAAEARVRELEAQLAALTEAQAGAATNYGEAPVDEHSLSLFDDPQPIDDPARAADGSDPTVLPMALIGVGVVAGLATLLAFVNDRDGFGLLMLGVTVLLLWLASATWVTPIEVSVNRGIVYIDHGTTKHRFDLRNERTQVEMNGEPGDRDWEVRFVRRGLDPFVIRDGMVDARTFVSRLREWRPEL
jgi:hypothetical protein